MAEKEKNIKREEKKPVAGNPFDKPVLIYKKEPLTDSM